MGHVAAPRAGATVVEFALVAPVLFLFLFGMIEWGRMVMVQQSLTSAVRDGCRMAVLSTSNSQQAVVDHIRKELRSVIQDSSNSKKVRVTVSPSSLTNITPGTSITVGIDVYMFDVSWLPRNILELAGNPVMRAHASQTRE